MVGVDVAEQAGVVHVADDDIDLAVVEQVAECCSTAYADSGESCAFDCRDELELSVGEVVEEQRALGVCGAPVGVFVGLGINVAVGDEEILPAVVVVVEESVAEAYEGDSWCADTCLVADIGEGSRAVVAEEHVVVVGERSADDAEVAIVLVVAGGEAHVGNLAAVAVESEAAGVALVLGGRRHPC